MVRKVKLGGKDYPVSFGFGALIEFEELSGKDVMRGGLEEIGMKDMGQLIYCGIKAGYRLDGKKGEAPEMLDVMDMLTVNDFEPLVEVLQSFMPEEAVGEESEPQEEGETA